MQCSKYETCLNADKMCGACTTMCDIYDHYPLFRDKNIMDRHTALCVLKDISKDMRAVNDIFGNPVLIIDRDKFEAVRKKYLDKEEV